MNRVKALQSAERMLKQGKVQAALGELQRIAQAAPDDLLTLNRLGDLLARQGRREEAIGYYERIAERFASGGFFPKAIAIYKKIVRLDADHLEALVKLGEMYLARKLPGEARGYILHAADTWVQRQEFDKAREGYETLARAEPEDPRHRIRMAEARAAGGDAAGAGEELVELAARLRSGGKPREAETIYRRAAELLPGRAEPSLGLSTALAEQGRADEALELLEQATAGGEPPPALQAELAVRLEAAGRHDEALERIATPACVEMPPEAVAGFIGQRIERGEADTVWPRLDPVLHEAAEHDPQALAALLETVGSLEQPGHVPAVERLHGLHRRLGDRDGEVRALEWLVRIYRDRQMEREAERALSRLTELDPGSAVVSNESGQGAAECVSPPEPPSEVAAAQPVAKPVVKPAAAEPSAVREEEPGDQDFVTGRLTQAEILEKYGLRQKAAAQLEEILERYPEHVEARRRMVALLRPGAPKRPLVHALVELALTLHATGRTDAAAEAAAEATSFTAELALRDQQRLREAGLLIPESEGGATPAGAGDADPAVAAAPEGAAKEIEIDLDLGEIDAPLRTAPEAAEPQRTAPKPAEPRSAEPRRADGARTPQPELLAEISGFIEAGSLDEATARLEALATLGYGGEALQGLRSRLEAARPAAEEPQATTFAADDLSALTAALEEELFADEDESAPPLVPRAEDDQSVDEIFAAFKQQVHAEVEKDDFRTHYDLGIAYKEMGLVDEAIEQFESVARSEELYREASTMLAICHRERGEMARAADWFRRALEASDDEPESTNGLRYDLADVLLQTGDTDSALDLFRQVLDVDPGYRDVEARVSEIEARIRT